MKLDVGIFAYNEAERIGNVLADLSLQSILARPGIEVRFVVLANGCRDNTVEVANNFLQTLSPSLQSKFAVLDLPFKGKSKTWNHFVHSVANKDAEFLLFLDGDIRLPNADHILRMLDAFASRPELRIFNSRPVKVAASGRRGSSIVAKLVASMGGTFADYKTTVCGQCYMVRAGAITPISMPIGLPVEDGFIRAMILTDCLTLPENMARIHGDEDVWHTYESIAGLVELVNHQVRIIIGSSINAVVFSELVESSDNFAGRVVVLRIWSQEEEALEKIANKRLPRWPFGYVPFAFLTKRIRRMMFGRLSPKLVAFGLVGFLFDAIVYVVASYKMHKGSGSGYW